MRTFVATKNVGKLAEMQAIFAGSPLQLETFEDYIDVDETSDRYLGNARLKAKALYKQLQARGIHASVLADDSGLEVDALDGRPGIFSARYAGRERTWGERRRYLLAEIANVPKEKRGARFVCTMVLLLPNGEERSGAGSLSGRITSSEKGEGGFGYDPIFVPGSEMRTFAEYSFDEKNIVSHRKKAADALLAQLSAKE